MNINKKVFTLYRESNEGFPLEVQDWFEQQFRNLPDYYNDRVQIIVEILEDKNV